MDMTVQLESKLQFSNCKVRCVWKMIFSLQQSSEIMMSIDFFKENVKQQEGHKSAWKLLLLLFGT